MIQSIIKFSGIQNCLFFTLTSAGDCTNSFDGRSEWKGRKSEPLSLNFGIENNKVEQETRIYANIHKKSYALLAFLEVSILCWSGVETSVYNGIDTDV
jgi:hypothetical protein